MATTHEGLLTLLLETAVRSRDTLEVAGRRAVSTVSDAVGPVESLAEGLDKARDVVLALARERTLEEDEDPLTQVLANEPKKKRSARDRLQKLLKDTSYAPAAVRHSRFDEIVDSLNVDEARILAFLARQTPVAALEVRAATRASLWSVPVLANVSRLGERAGCEIPEWDSYYIKRLQTLGLVAVDEGERKLRAEYQALREHALVIAALERVENEMKLRPRFVERSIRLSDLGTEFCEACVLRQRRKG